jgi:16S rRNA (cytosine1402-N4)-methyltransferase
MLAEVLAGLESGPGMVIADATFGAGGYSRALLEAGASVIAFDRDPTAEAFAQSLAGYAGFRLVCAPFSQMNDEIAAGELDGLVFDLGLSSMQLDQAERGFSLMRDGPLDMRMSREGPTAASLVNTADVGELARIFRVYGEERQPGRVAKAIERRRAEAPFEQTLDLAQVVEHALGGRRGARIHPATRVFQALRIAVNEELAELEAGLVAAERNLKAGGRLAVVTFHSLEDRIVKSFLNQRSGRLGEGSRHAPPRVESRTPSFLMIRGGQAPSEAEVSANPRARSARLRTATRTAAPGWGAAP